MEREPRIVLALLAAAVLAHAVRTLAVGPVETPGQVFAPGRRSDDPLAQRERALRLARPLAPGETVDLNSATAEEIARLPRIGMSLAKRIADYRDSRGPFWRLEDLDRVPGVGPALLSLLPGRVVFGGPRGSGFSPENPANPSTSGGYGAVPGVPARALVDPNSASLADLMALPGIGRARARAILAYRLRQGPFAVLSDLERVPGFSQSVVERLRPLVTLK